MLDIVLYIVFLFGSFVSEIPTVILMLFFTTLLWSFDLVRFEDIQQGLVNEGLITLMIAIVLTKAFSKAFFIEKFVLYLNYKIKNYNLFIGLFLLMVILVSSVLANTIVFMIFMPFLIIYCQNYNLPITKYILPLSYASILGGVLTMIGTTNNLVLNTFLQEKLKFFEITQISFLPAILGFIYLLIIYKFIPKNLYKSQENEIYRIQCKNLFGDSFLIGDFLEKRFLPFTDTDQNLIHANETIEISLDEGQIKFQLEIFESKTGYLYIGNNDCSSDIIGYTLDGECLYFNNHKINYAIPFMKLNSLTYLQKIIVGTSFILFIIGQILNKGVLFGFYSLLLNWMFRTMSFQEIMDSLNLNLYFLIAFSFPIGVYIENSVLSTFLRSFMDKNILATLCIIVFFSCLFSELITNPSSAIIMYYITRKVTIISPKTCILAILMGTNSCFMNPNTYPTHILAKEHVSIPNIFFICYGFFLNLMNCICSVALLYLLKL